MNLPEDFLLKKLLDPVTFVEGFIKIETPEEGLQEWDTDSYQKHLLRDTSRFRVINKSKKTGISTTIAGESIHKAYIRSGRQIVFVSTGLRIAEELLGKLYDMVNSMPKELQPKFNLQNKQAAQLSNGSRIMSLPSTEPQNIRGLGLRGPSTDVYVDEFAHVANDNELWIVVRDFQILGGKITLNSTPKGKRGKYWKIAEPLQTVFHGLIKPFETEWSYHEIPYWACQRLYAQEASLKEGMSDIDFDSEYCLISGSRIVTDNGIKQIEEINIGEKVYSHTGIFNEITKTSSRNYLGEVIQIYTYKSKTPLTLTPEHKILTLKISACKFKTRKIRCLPECSLKCKNKYKKIPELTWVQAKDLQKYDMIAYPKRKRVFDSEYMDISKYIKTPFREYNGLLYTGGNHGMWKKNSGYVRLNSPKNAINRLIKVDEYLLRLIGYFLSEGSIGALGRQVCFSFGKDEKNKKYVDDCRYCIKKSFGIKSKVNIRQNVTSVLVNNKLLGDFFKIFGNNSKNKSINEAWIKNLPPEKLRHLLVGCWNGDGCYTNTQNRYGSVSEKLVYQLRDILVDNGYFPSIYSLKMKEDSKIGDRKIHSNHKIYGLVYYNKLTNDDRGVRGLQDENYVYLPIRKINHINYVGKVYNLEVKNDNSYCAEYYAVHNCCIFCDESLSFFPFELIENCQTIKEFAASTYKTRNPVYFGIDFGKTTSETIVYIVEEVSPEHFKTLYIEILPGVNYDDQIQIIALLNSEYNPTMIKIDSTGPGGQTMQDLLTARQDFGHKIFGYNLGSAVKENIVIRLRMLMQRKKVDLPTKDMREGELLEHQLHSIKRTTTESGMHTRYSGKETGMDDMVFALALAVFKEFELDNEPMLKVVTDPILEAIHKKYKSSEEAVFGWMETD